tara:strand:+ start:23 stop:652 length:630 start_codon:yes stop_codon:yes gene_type:complete
MEDSARGFVHSMFNVPIVYYPLENWSENKKKILDALPVEDDTQLVPEEHGLYTDFFINTKADKQHLPSYFYTVLGVIKPCLENLPFPLTEEERLEFVDMWYQKYYKGVQHQVHVHGHSGWSSVIYVEFDPEVHQATTFYSPFRNPWNGNIETFTPPVSEGDMVIFPSTIMHEAAPNKSDKRRTIVSFNIRGHVDLVKHICGRQDASFVR